MTDREVVLEAHDLTRYYRSRSLRTAPGGGSPPTKALDGVSLSLRRGETLGIVGESGCGKSTLARLLVGLERPTSGRVTVVGEDLFALRSRQLRRARRKIQIVLQNPYAALDPRMSVRAIVGEPFEIHGDILPRHRRDDAVRQLLEAVGIGSAHLDRFPHELSGGQLQRIAIARALALRPQILVCDEPVSALDVSIQAQVVNLLGDLQEEFGIACVFIAHDLAVVRHVSDRIAVMYLGRIVETGETDQIYDRPVHPYTQALQSAGADPFLDGGSTGRRIVLRGEIPNPSDPPGGCSFHPRCWRSQAVCRDMAPSLEIRPGTDHPSACHFASVDRQLPARSVDAEA
jgi:oligopeptide transport system ATP-binding protein